MQLDFLCRLPSLRELHLQQATSLFNVQRMSEVTNVILTAATHLDLSPLQDLRSLKGLFSHGGANEHLHNLSTLSGLVQELALGRGQLPADAMQLTIYISLAILISGYYLSSILFTCVASAGS